MNNSENLKFNLLDLIRAISFRWLLLTLLLIAGGLAGLMFSNLRPPVYESSADFGVTIDYTQTGALSDVQEDQILRGVGSVLLSDNLVANAVKRINQEVSYQIDAEEFRDNAFADRGDFRWTIRYRESDPERVFFIAQNWTQASVEAFDQALVHAQTTESYLQALDDLQSCYQESGFPPSEGFCGFESSEALLAEIAQLAGKIQEEKQASQGLFYALSINLVSSPELAESPIRHQTNLMVLAGALAGLVIGISYLIVRYFRRGRSA